MFPRGREPFGGALARATARIRREEARPPQYATMTPCRYPNKLLSDVERMLNEIHAERPRVSFDEACAEVRAGSFTDDEGLEFMLAIAHAASDWLHQPGPMRTVVLRASECILAHGDSGAHGSSGTGGSKNAHGQGDAGVWRDRDGPG